MLGSLTVGHICPMGPLAASQLATVSERTRV